MNEKQQPIQARDLVGSWSLESFDLQEDGEPSHPWGFDTHGLLIYGSSGHMSVAINRYAPWSETGRPAQASDGTSRLLFYAGTYSVDGDTVSHQVTEASDLSRIGTVMTRKARMGGSLLHLLAEGPGFVARLVWKRVE